MSKGLFAILVTLLGVASLLVVLVVTFFVPSSWLEAQVEIERQSIIQWLGQETAIQLINDSDQIYRKTFVTTGIVQKSYYLFVPTKEEDEKSGALEGFGHQYHEWINDSIRSWWLVIYQFIQRFILIKQWVWLAILPIMASVFDGMMTRKIKQVSYGYSSPVLYRLGIEGVILSSILLLFYMSYPAAPPASPLWPLGWYLSMTVFLRLTSANIQKML